MESLEKDSSVNKWKVSKKEDEIHQAIRLMKKIKFMTNWVIKVKISKYQQKEELLAKEGTWRE